MLKSHKFNELSDKKCVAPGCGKLLKARLVAGKQPQNIRKCWKHYAEIRYPSGKCEVSHRDAVRL